MAQRLKVEDGQLDNAGNYIEHDYDADPHDVCLLLEELKGTKEFVHFKSQCFCVDFSYLSDTSFEVEIYDLRDGFWAISEVDMVAARKIVEMVSENEKFDELIPTTNELWGAYGGGQFA
jgi:hypothetical protein